MRLFKKKTYFKRMFGTVSSGENFVFIDENSEKLKNSLHSRTEAEFF